MSLMVITLAALAVHVRSTQIRNGNLRALGEVTAVVDTGRGAVVVTTVRFGQEHRWLVSDDARLMEHADADAPAGPGLQSCAGEVCYRAAGTALRVAASTDGGQSYTTAWEVTGKAYATLLRTYPALGDPAAHLASRSLVVHPVPSGHVVFVANGRDGLLYRNADGDWQRLGVPDSGEGCCFFSPTPPLTTDRPATLPRYVVGLVVTVIVGAGVIAAVRRRRWPAVPAVAALAVLGAYLAYLGTHMPPVGMFPAWVYGAPIVVGCLAGGPALAVWYAGGIRWRPHRRIGRRPR